MYFLQSLTHYKQTLNNMDPEALKNLSPQQQQEIISQVQQQVALANMQELLQKVTDKCFKRCITSPGSSMSSSDNKCVSLCMDRSVIKLAVSSIA